MNELEKALSMTDENGFVTLRTCESGVGLWSDYRDSFYVWFDDSDDAKEDDIFIKVHQDFLSMSKEGQIYVISNAHIEVLS